MTTPQRPKFDPAPSDASMKVSENGWIPLITCAANFPIEVVSYVNYDGFLR